MSTTVNNLVQVHYFQRIWTAGICTTFIINIYAKLIINVLATRLSLLSLSQGLVKRAVSTLMI